MEWQIDVTIEKADVAAWRTLKAVPTTVQRLPWCSVIVKTTASAGAACASIVFVLKANIKHGNRVASKEDVRCIKWILTSIVSIYNKNEDHGQLT